MVEHEYKVLLSLEEYNLIDKEFKWNEIRNQTNYYYLEDDDKKDIEEKSKITIRIREYKEKYKLQVKTNVNSNKIKVWKDSDKSMHIKNEFSKEKDGICEIITSDELFDLCNIRFRDAKLIGYLKTERKVLYAADDVEICLDKNEYLGAIDYELEIEFKAKVPTNIINKIEEKGIKFNSYSKGKFKRFIYKYKDNLFDV